MVSENSHHEKYTLKVKIPSIHDFEASVVLRTLRSLPTGHQHGDVVPIEQDLVQPGHPPTLAGALVLHHVVQHHVDKVVETQQGAHHLLVILHDDVDP